MIDKNYFYYLFFAVWSVSVSGCGGDEKPPQVITKTVTEKPAIIDPFRYHKLIEVSPGQYYDVLSWGRGSTTVGAFMILHSDSAAKKYTTTTGDLDGTIVDVYNSDMDVDGNPEIIIQAKSNDTINYTNIYAFEFTYGRAQKLPFPALTKSQKKGYRGGDNFYIKEGQFFREFPIYEGNGAEAKPSGQKRLLQYGLRNNYFTVKQVSKDSTKTDGIKPNVPAPTSTAPTEKKVPAMQKHTPQKKHKRKHRRRKSSEE